MEPPDISGESKNDPLYCKTASSETGESQRYYSDPTQARICNASNFTGNVGLSVGSISPDNSFLRNDRTCSTKEAIGAANEYVSEHDNIAGIGPPPSELLTTSAIPADGDVLPNEDCVKSEPAAFQSYPPAGCQYSTPAGIAGHIPEHSIHITGHFRGLSTLMPCQETAHGRLTEDSTFSQFDCIKDNSRHMFPVQGHGQELPDYSPVTGFNTTTLTPIPMTLGSLPPEPQSFHPAMGYPFGLRGAPQSIPPVMSAMEAQSRVLRMMDQPASSCDLTTVKAEPVRDEGACEDDPSGGETHQELSMLVDQWAQGATLHDRPSLTSNSISPLPKISLNVVTVKEEPVENSIGDAQTVGRNIALEAKEKVGDDEDEPHDNKVDQNKVIGRNDKCGSDYNTEGDITKLYESDQLYDPVGSVYRCPKCEYKTDRKHLLHLHMKRTHAPEDPVSCPTCRKVYGNQMKLRNHIRIYHVSKVNCTCDICGKQLCNKQSLKEHKKMKHAEKVFVCEIDGKAFGSERSLQRHREGVHNGNLYTLYDEQMHCPRCQYKTNKKQLFAKHVRTTHAPQVACPCPQCGKVFGNKYKLKTHVWKYHSVSTEESRCVVCSKLLCNKQSLKEHMLNMHSPEKSYVCEVDGKAFGSYLSLKRHMRCTHGEGQSMLVVDPGELKCSICSFQAEKKDNLRIHMRRVHDQKPVECPHCSKIYNNRARMQAHLTNVLRAEKNKETGRYVCQICSKKLSTPQCLREHMNGVHSCRKEYLCPACSKTYATELRLRRHMCVMHDTSGSPKYLNKYAYTPVPDGLLCDLCGYTADKPYQYHNHMQRVHGPEKPSPCPHCGKVYDTEYKMKKHLNRYHSPVQETTCNLCSKELSTRECLRKHVQRVHENPEAGQADQWNISRAEGPLAVGDDDDAKCEDGESIDVLGNGSEKEDSLSETTNISLPSSSSEDEDGGGGYDKPSSSGSSHLEPPATLPRQEIDVLVPPDLTLSASDHPQHMFKCTFCNTNFPTPDALSRHMWAQHV